MYREASRGKETEEEEEMKAFHNDKKVKEKYLARVIAHQNADNLIRGRGWQNGKGCAVGCTLEAYNHARYEAELGIPEWLARVEDSLFEGMSEAKSHTWPEKFLEAIPIGADLEPVKVQFIVMLLKYTLKSMDAAKYDENKWPQVKRAIEQSKSAVKQMIAAQESGDNKTIEAAWSAAWSAAESAASAAWSAASAASAAWSAASAARSAASAARSAASAAYDYYADELLKMLKKAK